jgi:DNA polymerase (family 10)
VDACAKRGYRYCLITDHSQSLHIAHGLEMERLLARGKEIAELNKSQDKIRVLWGTECDILPDGTLDYPDEVLAKLDLVIASVHTAFGKDTTGRTIKALGNPHVDIVAHPSGRVITEREAFELDVEAVARTAAEQGKALEINSFPDRLDLARDLGAKIVVNTDAHAPEHLDYIKYGIITARRGWLEAKDIINTWDLSKLLAWAKHA